MPRSRQMLFPFVVLFLLWAVTASPIPPHNHGEGWTSWENDPVGAFEEHNHTWVESEAGDTCHQHYITHDFNGSGNHTEDFSAYGAWDDETGYVDLTDPFCERYPTDHVPHGFIEEGYEPDYYFKGDWSDTTAVKARALIDQAFYQWSRIHADMSPVTGKPLRTGIGFEPTDNENVAEIIVEWRPFQTDCNGGEVTVTDGTHTAANPANLSFDSSKTFEFEVGGAAQPGRWDFFSVALHEVGHLVFLEHHNDEDLMAPPVGEPLDYDCPDPVPDGFRWHWTGLQENPGENDYFRGWRFSDDGTAIQITDKDSVDGAKSLYSIPTGGPSSVETMSWGMIKTLYRPERSGERTP